MAKASVDIPAYAEVRGGEGCRLAALADGVAVLGVETFCQQYLRD